MTRLITMIIISILFLVGCDNKEQEALEQQRIEEQTLKYTSLREWQPNNNINGLGLDILLEGNLEVDSLISLIKELSIGKDPVVISIYTDEKVYNNVKNNIYGEPFDQHFILMYVQNNTGKGIYNGCNEIRWMQEIGKFSGLFGTKTQLE